MRQPFTPPAPIEGEQHETFLMRVAQAFADWFNEPIELTLSGELVRQAAAESRAITITINGPYCMTATLAELAA